MENPAKKIKEENVRPQQVCSYELLVLFRKMRERNALGQLPATGFQSTNKRFVNKNDPDNGSIMARHFATSISDCMKLCQWTQGQ